MCLSLSPCKNCKTDGIIFVTLGSFSKICRQIQALAKIGQHWRTLYMDNCVSLCGHSGHNSRYIFIGNKITIHRLLTAWRREAESILVGQQIPVFFVRSSPFPQQPANEVIGSGSHPQTKNQFNIVEPFLCNDSEIGGHTMAVSGQRLCKHVSVPRQ
jgi:hypothetical protein